MIKKIFLTFSLITFISVLSFSQTGTDDIPEPEAEEENPVFEFFQVQEKAYYMYGDSAMYAFIVKNIELPDSMLSGTVIVSFTVEKDSSLSNVIIDPRSRKMPEDHHKSALDVVSKMSGKWVPAKARDKNVRMRFSLPIRFSGDK